MPRYDYKCNACDAEFEANQSMMDDPLTNCPHCKRNELNRLISGAGVIFKGSGFYVNDTKNGNKTQNTNSSSQSKPAKATEATSNSSA